MAAFVPALSGASKAPDVARLAFVNNRIRGVLIAKNDPLFPERKQSVKLPRRSALLFANQETRRVQWDCW